MDGKNPILGKGEELIQPASKRSGSGPVNYPYTWERARARLKSKVNTLSTQIEQIDDDYRLRDVVVTLRLNEKFLAKSYIPDALFNYAGIENIGSRRWTYYNEDKDENVNAKMHFVRLNEAKLRKLNEILDKRDEDLPKNFKEDVRKIEEFDTISSSEVCQGFEDDWSEGTVEFVFHPFEDENENLLESFNNILKKHGEDLNYKLKQYSDGPTFVSATVSKNTLDDLVKFNPLRTVHPLESRDFPELREVPSESLSIKPPKGENKSNIKVGIFDGGVESTHPFLKYSVANNNIVSSAPSLDGIMHGTAVAGAVLYGNLGEYEINQQLEDPIISIEDFRVLPPSSNIDHELYEAIDAIESVVPQREDIKVYNLSFGPRGPIVDDEISRFTYALDRLAWEHKVLFVVAVGNDGDLEEPFNRVQAPADLVNGLGIGAYTIDTKNGGFKRAEYSSVGQGREGCKVKPDICGFGGDVNTPIQLLHAKEEKRVKTMGTSFASPIIAGKAAEILGRCDQFNALSARAILIHNANHYEQGDIELGHGYINQNADEMLYTDEESVTIVYQNSIQPKSMAKLPIPLPNNIDYNGQVEISWTTAVASKTNPLHSEDYTNSCIVETFYPHSKKFRINPPKGDRNSSKTKHLETDKKEIERLLSLGWKTSQLPVTKSPDKYQTEDEKRINFKWDTVVKNSTRMMSKSLENPFLVLHGIGRNTSDDTIHYSTVVTIKLNGFEGDLTQEILNEFKVLQPVNIKARNEVMVRA